MALAAAAPLGGALVSQYGFGYAPCELCMLQRYPYVLVLALAALSFILPRHCTWFAWLAVLAFLATSGTGLFHLGVEQGWWEFDSACSSLTTGKTIDDLRNAILQAPLVSCNQPQFTVLGLSMAGWNMLAGFGFAAAFVYLICRKEIAHDA